MITPSISLFLSPPPSLPPSPSQGILEAYHYAVNHTELYGPTNFSSFLDKAIESAKGSVTQESQNYNLLLVITVSFTLHKHLTALYDY